MKRDFSPEEKLLRLIKGAGKKDAAKDRTEEGGAASRAAAPSLNNNRWPGQPPKPAQQAFLSNINTRSVNPALIFILTGLLLYFVFDAVSNPYARRAPSDVLNIKDEPSAAKGAAAPVIEPYSYYSSQVEKRSIFSPQEGETSAAAAGPTAEEISSNLSLIGIIAGDKPQAIIEDKKAGKSYFVYKAGTVGGARIIDILEDRVVMECQGKQFELML
jgi:hypothetical protein